MQSLLPSLRLCYTFVTKGLADGNVIALGGLQRTDPVRKLEKGSVVLTSLTGDVVWRANTQSRRRVNRIIGLRSETVLGVIDDGGDVALFEMEEGSPLGDIGFGIGVRDVAYDEQTGVVYATISDRGLHSIAARNVETKEELFCIRRPSGQAEVPSHILTSRFENKFYVVHSKIMSNTTTGFFTVHDGDSGAERDRFFLAGEPFGFIEASSTSVLACYRMCKGVQFEKISILNRSCHKKHLTNEITAVSPGPTMDCVFAITEDGHLATLDIREFEFTQLSITGRISDCSIFGLSYCANQQLVVTVDAGTHRQDGGVKIFRVSVDQTL